MSTSIKIFISVALSLIVLGGGAAYSLRPTWPQYQPTAKQKAVAKTLISEYQAAGLDASRRSQEYSAIGDYMNYSKTVSYKSAGRVKLDSNGIPMIKYGDTFQYNPVTLSHYALSVYGSTLPGKPNKNFWIAVNKLVSIQSLEGAFRYNFSYRHYLLKKAYPPGWISGMAQGNALSVLARAYSASKRPDIFDAGNKALRFLTVPIEHGGPLTSMKDLDESLDGYLFFEEYVGDGKAIYTLNGYMFTLLGIYDWWQVTDSKEAKYLFNEGIRTLEKILPYYDFGGFSAYDLGHITYEKEIPHAPLRYHATHLSLLNCLYSITYSPTLKKYAEHWQESVTIKNIGGINK